MAAVRLDLPYPVSVNRYWRRGLNVTYVSKEGYTYKHAVRAIGCRAGVKPFSEDVCLCVRILPRMKLNGEPFRKSVDIDNGLKCVLDSLQGVLYMNDRQVKRLVVDYGAPVRGGGCVVWAERLEG